MMNTNHNYFLPAEWHKQAFAQITWPDETTDWRDILDQAIHCFIQIAHGIVQNEPLLIVTQKPEETAKIIQDSNIIPPDFLSKIRYSKSPINDTWARDHAFLTCFSEKGDILLSDFQFNGWGEKFNSQLDNQINQNIFNDVQTYYHDICHKDVEYNDSLDFILEGGSIEVDGNGTLMTTSHCIFTKSRNFRLTKKQIIQRLKDEFGVSKILILNHGLLEGDDTDGHIDTLARFCPDNVIAYVACNDEKDSSHFTELKAMEDELKSFTNKDGKHYTLIPLPMPNEIRDENGLRLPATYANFFIINGAVLVPIYGQPLNDELAVRQLQKAFPTYKMIAIDCNVLIRQHGSLHCSTMQYPEPPSI